MKIIESTIVGKKNQEACEDGLVVTDDFIAVIDGSTSKTPKQLSPKMKNGRYAMMLISEYIQQKLSPESTVDDFCQVITEYIRNKVYAPLDIIEWLRLHPEERLTASAIIYSNKRKEIWMVGDCQAIIDGKLFDNSKPYELAIAQKRAALIHKGITPTDARKAIEPMLIKAMMEGQNINYAVIDGFPIYRNGIRVISIPSIPSQTNNATTEIILASDGYSFLKPTLAESEKALSQLIATDPQCIQHFIATKGLTEGNKSFDDRTYIRFETE